LKDETTGNGRFEKLETLGDEQQLAHSTVNFNDMFHDMFVH